MSDKDEKRFKDVVKRLLQTPPKPHKPKDNDDDKREPIKRPTAK